MLKIKQFVLTLQLEMSARNVTDCFFETRCRVESPIHAGPWLDQP